MSRHPVLDPRITPPNELPPEGVDSKYPGAIDALGPEATGTLSISDLNDEEDVLAFDPDDGSAPIFWGGPDAGWRDGCDVGVFTEVPCRCGGNICGLNRDDSVRKRRYKCRGCRRWVPRCFGAADDMPFHCDDCWAAAHSREP